MIFVTVGTNETPFDRLVRAVGELEVDEELVVQSGSSRVVLPAHVTSFESLPFEQLLDHAARARVVVAHAGVGSVLSVMSAGKKPIVVPRLHQFGEAVDDHQLVFGRRLEADGFVVLVEDEHELQNALRQPTVGQAPQLRGNGLLARELGEFVATRVAMRRNTNTQSSRA
jgi:UDP-N-acetylglucosamine transferase subunit ALG13